MHNLFAAMATRLKDVPELRNNVAYPRPAAIERSPLTILYPGAPREGAGRGIGRKFDVQEWDVVPVVRVLVDTNFEAPRERDLLTRLLPRIVDAFDPSLYPGGMSALMPSVKLRSFTFVDYEFGEVTYNAAQNAYALDVIFGTRFERVPVAIPIGGTP